VTHDDNIWGITLEESSEIVECRNNASNLPEGLHYAFDQPLASKV
jgi:hypothetical protein